MFSVGRKELLFLALNDVRRGLLTAELCPSEVGKADVLGIWWITGSANDLHRQGWITYPEPGETSALTSEGEKLFNTLKTDEFVLDILDGDDIDLITAANGN